MQAAGRRALRRHLASGRPLSPPHPGRPAPGTPSSAHAATAPDSRGPHRAAPSPWGRGQRARPPPGRPCAPRRTRLPRCRARRTRQSPAAAPLAGRAARRRGRGRRRGCAGDGRTRGRGGRGGRSGGGGGGARRAGGGGGSSARAAPARRASRDEGLWRRSPRRNLRVRARAVGAGREDGGEAGAAAPPRLSGGPQPGPWGFLIRAAGGRAGCGRRGPGPGPR